MTRRAVLAAVGGVALPARAQSRRWRITYANLSDEVPFTAAVARSIRQAATSRPEIELTVLDNRCDPAKSVENARIVATSRPDLFIQYNSSAAVNVQVGRIVVEAGVKMLAVQTAIPNAPLFAVDNVRAGTDSGEYLSRAAKERWGNAAPVGVIANVPESGPLFLERGNGTKDAIRRLYPSIRFQEFSTHNDPALTRQTATDILTRNPASKVLVWAHVDAMALACLAAVRNTGRSDGCLITTIGGDRAVFPELRRSGSPLIGTYSFFPEFWGNDLLDLSLRMLRGEAFPERTAPRRAEMVTADNINALYPPS